MNKTLSKIALLLILGCWQPLQAQDLAEIYRLALENDAELMIAEANYLAAVQALPLATSGRKPQISFDASASARESDNSETGSNESDSLGYSVSLTQPLYNTEISDSVAAAEAAVDAALARVQAARQSLVLRVAQSYFAVLAAQDNVDFAYAERNAIARQLEQAQKRFEVGLIAITDVQEAQARFDTAEAQAIEAENLLETSYQSLATITGDPSLRDLSRLGSELNLEVPYPSGVESWVKLALEFNRDLIAAQNDLEAVRFERRRAARSGYPTVDLTASYSDTDVEGDELRGDFDQQDLTVGVQLQVPLYTGGRISAEQARTEAEFVAAKNNVLLQSRLAQQQARTAYLTVVSDISKVNALNQALESSQIALEATRAGFEVGTRTSVDVLVSLRETFRAQRDYASSRYEYLLNILRLRQSAGIVEDDNLIEINQLLTD